MMSSFVRSLRPLMAVLLVAICGTLLLAQSTTDGAIGGTVYDTNGAVVPGAKITVHNNGTNAEQTTATDDSGFYRVTKLQPGSYTVTVNQQGFAPYKAEQVIVQVGSMTDMSPRLAVGSTTEVVNVTAEAPQINYTSPDFAPTLNQTAIENLPINGGRWSSFAILTPGVVSDSNGFGLLSFRGISVLLNNNTVDGADNNQAFFSEERGRTRAGYSTPQIAVQEFQVNTSNYSAEYGRSAGGVVNTVTKSGTNALHGEVDLFDRDNDWGAMNEFTKLSVQTSPGNFVQQPYKPKDWRKRVAGQIGGPAIKDKLFYSLTFDWYDRNFPGTAVATNPNAFFAQQFDGTDGVHPASANIIALAKNLTGSSSPTQAQLTQALNIYNTDLAGLATMLGPVPRDGEQYIIYPKIDWQMDQKNHLSLTFNRMRWESPAGIQTQATNSFARASFGNDFVKDTWGIAKLDTFFSANLANEMRFQYGRDFEYENNQTPTPYEQANLLNTPTFTNPLGLPPQVSITNGFTFGLPNFLQRPKFPDERRAQVADTVNWTHAKHNFKFGMDFSHVNDNSQNLFQQFGQYSYGSLVNYFTDLNRTNGCGGKACYTSFSQAFGPLGKEFNTKDWSLFAQDDWKILPRLSLSLGLRWEFEQLPEPFFELVTPSQNAAPGTAHMPTDMNNFGPRAGFAYDIFGDGKTVIRGGYGVYYGRVINSSIFNALLNTGAKGGQLSFTFTPGAGAPAFPFVFASAPSGTVKPNVVYFDPNFQLPQIRQADLTLERDLGWGTVVSLSYLGSFGRQLPDFVDTNLNPSTSTITYRILNGGPLGSLGTYTTPLFAGTRPNPKLGAMTDVFSGVTSNYQAMSVQVNHRMSHHVQFSTNYTWSHALDNGVNGQTFTATNSLFDPFNLNKDYGNSIYNVPNRLVVNAVADSPWKFQGWAGRLLNDWTLSPIYQIQNGLPYTASVSGNAPGGTTTGINGSGGNNRIDFLRDAFRQPSTWVTDIRLAKKITVRERYSVELLTDFFNLANKQNVTQVNNTGYFVSTGTVQTPSGPVTCSAAAPCLNFDTDTSFNTLFGSTTATNSNFVYSPRQIQIGAKIRF
jgi:carboxypeptidase family protein